MIANIFYFLLWAAGTLLIVFSIFHYVSKIANRKYLNIASSHKGIYILAITILIYILSGVRLFIYPGAKISVIENNTEKPIQYALLRVGYKWDIDGRLGAITKLTYLESTSHPVFKGIYVRYQLTDIEGNAIRTPYVGLFWLAWKSYNWKPILLEVVHPLYTQKSVTIIKKTTSFWQFYNPIEAIVIMDRKLNLAKAVLSRNGKGICKEIQMIYSDDNYPMKNNGEIYYELKALRVKEREEQRLVLKEIRKSGLECR